MNCRKKEKKKLTPLSDPLADIEASVDCRKKRRRKGLTRAFDEASSKRKHEDSQDKGADCLAVSNDGGDGRDLDNNVSDEGDYGTVANSTKSSPLGISQYTTKD